MMVIYHKPDSDCTPASDLQLNVSSKALDATVLSQPLGPQNMIPSLHERIRIRPDKPRKCRVCKDLSFSPCLCSFVLSFIGFFFYYRDYNGELQLPLLSVSVQTQISPPSLTHWLIHALGRRSCSAPIWWWTTPSSWWYGARNRRFFCASQV